MDLIRRLRLLASRLRVPSRVRQVVRRRRLTITVSGLCVAALFGLAFWLRGAYRIESRSLSIGLYTTGEVLRVSSIMIDKGQEVDSISISFGFVENASSRTHSFSVEVPAAWKLNKETSGLTGMTATGITTRESSNWYYFTVEDKARTGCSLDFEGKLVTTHSRELDLELWINTGSGLDTGSTLTLGQGPEFPITLTIRGLGTTDVGYVRPDPIRRSFDFIQYDPLPWKIVGHNPIELQMQDRVRRNRTDYTVFLVGVLVGVVSSLLASTLWDVLKEREMARRAREP